MLFNNY